MKKTLEERVAGIEISIYRSNELHLKIANILKDFDERITKLEGVKSGIVCSKCGLRTNQTKYDAVGEAFCVECYDEELAFRRKDRK